MPLYTHRELRTRWRNCTDSAAARKWTKTGGQWEGLLWVRAKRGRCPLTSAKMPASKVPTCPSVAGTVWPCQVWPWFLSEKNGISISVSKSSHGLFIRFALFQETLAHFAQAINENDFGESSTTAAAFSFVAWGDAIFASTLSCL